MTFHHDRVNHILRLVESTGLHETHDNTKTALSRLTGKPARVAEALGLVYDGGPEPFPDEDVDIVTAVRNARRAR